MKKRTGPEGERESDWGEACGAEGLRDADRTAGWQLGPYVSLH